MLCKKPSEIMSDEIKVAADEIKAAEMVVAATVPGIVAISGRRILVTGDDFMDGIQWNLKFPELRGLGRMPVDIVGAETVKGYTDKDVKNVAVKDLKRGFVDLEKGVMTEEVVYECYWKNECPEYVGYSNDHIERIVKELKDKGYVLEFISVEMAKELKDGDYGLMCIPSEPVKGLKDDGCALKFFPVEAVKMWKDDDCALKVIPALMVKELKEDGYALKFMPVEVFKNLQDEDYFKMESVGVIEAVEDECWVKNMCTKWFGYANDYIEKTVKPTMGIMFSAAIMQNIYQLVTSGIVTTGKGKTLLKLNEAAFMMLLYGLVMPRRAAGHIALAVGVALASAAYIVTMSFAF